MSRAAATSAGFDRQDLTEMNLPIPLGSTPRLLLESRFKFTDLYHTSKVAEFAGTAVCQCRTRPICVT